MKKAVIFSAICLSLLVSSAATAQKLGYVNSNELLKEMPEIKQADSDLQAFQAQLQKQGQAMVAELQKKSETLENRKTVGDIAPKQYDIEAAALKDEEAKINDFEQEMYKKLADKKETLYKPILDKVDAAIKTVSVEGKFLMIFDQASGVFLYADESQDVSKLVKTKLGISN